MDDILMYLQLGLYHISDPKGYDHILFIITLCAFYKLTDLKKLLILCTAFTLGHSITLLLSSLGTLTLPSYYVEILIPITILLTAIYNVWFYSKQSTDLKINPGYIMALVFGLVHGMGFSTFFKAIMGNASSIAVPLVSFNIGIEIGQLVIVLLFMTLLYILTQFFKIIHRDWNLFISGIGFGLATLMTIERIFNF